jgi:formylglycine-generating enzyme required for sulfatase activity
MKKTTALLSTLALLSACGDDTLEQNNQAPLAAPTSAPAATTILTAAEQNDVKNDAGQGDHSKIPMVLVHAGEFVRGSNKIDTEDLKERYGFTEPLYLDEHPQHRMSLPAFYIDTYETSNILFKEFILTTGRKLPFDWGQNGYGLTMKEAKTMDIARLRDIAANDFKLDMDTTQMTKEALLVEMEAANVARDQLPVTGIDWSYADQYCQWRGQRLPSEAEWEKAARGPNGLEFPWGSDFDEQKTNTGDNDDWEDGYAPVGSYPQNKSPYGAFDMGGNVWEWTNSWYEAYPGNQYNSQYYGQDRVIRGGGGGIGHYALSHFFRGASRKFAAPKTQNNNEKGRSTYMLRPS